MLHATGLAIDLGEGKNDWREIEVEGVVLRFEFSKKTGARLRGVTMDGTRLRLQGVGSRLRLSKDKSLRGPEAQI